MARGIHSELKIQRQRFREQARRYRKKAEEASAPGLREYYQGRADEAQSCANSLSRLVYQTDGET